MDWLVGKYAEAKLADMDADRLSHFERFLVLPDPDLNIWLMDPKRVTAPEFAGRSRAVLESTDRF